MTALRYSDDDLRRLLTIEADDVCDADVVTARVAATDRAAGRSAARWIVPLAAALVVVAVVVATIAWRSGREHSKVESALAPYTFTQAQAAPTLVAAGDREAAGHVAGPLLDGSGDYTQGGQITVVTFWGAWCGPCWSETEQLEGVFQAYRSDHVDVVGVDVKEASRGLPRAFVAKHDITYPMIYDPAAENAITLGNIPIESVPITVLIDSRHRVAGVYLQRVTAHELSTMLDQLLAER